MPSGEALGHKAGLAGQLQTAYDAVSLRGVLAIMTALKMFRSNPWLPMAID